MKQLTRLRFLRAHRTLQEVSVGASVSKWTYWRWEQHPERLRKVDVDTLDRLAVSLNATRGQLLDEDPIPGYTPPPAVAIPDQEDDYLPDEDDGVDWGKCPACGWTVPSWQCRDPRHTPDPEEPPAPGRDQVA